ncbi:hypothetical protein DIPPA_55569 [Diplonema papillatum]|nr:hypothetical protein DIPPA_55569 [Diplonema papillatum]
MMQCAPLLLSLFVLSLATSVEAKHRKHPLDEHRTCRETSDCACGAHKEDKEFGIGQDLCFVGNSKYIVSPLPGQCNTFCNGKRGELTWVCKNDAKVGLKTCQQKFTDASDIFHI